MPIPPPSTLTASSSDVERSPKKTPTEAKTGDERESNDEKEGEESEETEETKVKTEQEKEENASE